MQEEIEKRLSERVKELEKGSYVANPQNIIESDNPKDMLRQLFKNG
jgi:regulator of replication initiation timing